MNALLEEINILLSKLIHAIYLNLIGLRYTGNYSLGNYYLPPEHNSQLAVCNRV